MNPLRFGTNVNCLSRDCEEFSCRFDHITGKSNTEKSSKPFGEKSMCPYEWEITLNVRGN